MADHFLEFSEVIPRLTPEEEEWLRQQLRPAVVRQGKLYDREWAELNLGDATPDWEGGRFLYDFPDLEERDSNFADFEWELCDDSPGSEIGAHLWLHSGEGGDLEAVGHLVQKFLRQFRPQDGWCLTYATWCSKPRVGEFGGGAMFVTTYEIRWQNAYDWVEQQRKAWQRKQRKADQKKDPTGGPETPT